MTPLFSRFFILVLVLTLQFCGSEKEKDVRHESAGTREASEVTRVKSEPRWTEFHGTVRAGDVANLATRTGGFVREVAVVAGSDVRKGRLLMVIDDRSLQAQREKLQSGAAELDQAAAEAEHQLRAAESQAQLARSTFERMQTLYEKKAASRQEFEEAQARNDSADAARQAAEQRLAQIQEKKNQLRADQHDVAANMQYARIMAPFDGVVTSVEADEGTFANPGQTLITVVTKERYEFVFSIGEDSLQDLAGTTRASVRIPAMGNRRFEVTIDEISPAIDTTTGTFLVKATFVESAGLRNGLSGTILLQSSDTPSLWVPAGYIVRENDLEMIWGKEDGNWKRMLIRSGMQKDGMVEILSGLKENEEIARMEPSK